MNARFRPYLRPPKGMEDEWAALHPTLTVNEFDEIYTKRINHLIAASPVIVGNPSDWGDNVQIVGYPQWKTKNLGVSEKLMKFVSSGEPPIYIGFGSYSDRRFNGPEGRVLLEQIARAADNCGDRIVFQSTLSSINSSEDLPDNVFPTDTVSHDWLFPRCKAVVCHGGYGTMHTTLMARTPLIIYPLHNDQFFLAKRAEQLGFALPYRASATYDRVTAKQFGRDFKKLQERCAAMRERANTVAARVEREDPIRGHLDAIEKGLRGTVIRGAR